MTPCSDPLCSACGPADLRPARRLASLFLLSITVALVAVLSAAADWQPVGDRGGDFFDLQVLPGEPPTLLAVQDENLWRLEDPNGGWQPVAVPPPERVQSQGADLVPKDVRLVSVWVAPRDPLHILVSFEFDVDIVVDGTKVSSDHSGLLLKSHDGGATWSTVVRGARVRALAIAPSAPDLVYASLEDPQRPGSSPRFVRFTPGEHEPVELELPGHPEPVTVRDVAVDAADPAWVHVVTGAGGLYASSNGGESWLHAQRDALPVRVSGTFNAVAAHPTIPLSAHRFGSALAGTEAGAVWEASVDGAWSELAKPAAGVVSDLDLDPVDAERYYAVVGGVPYAIDDTRASWQALTDGLPDAEVLALEVDPGDPSRLFAAVAGEGVWMLNRLFPAEPCVPDATTLCLGAGGRFEVNVVWQDFELRAGRGEAVPLPAEDTGSFWFFDEENVELVVKVLDGRPVNAFHWVFYGALTNVQFTLEVTDTATGETIGYRNPSRRFASRGDTSAFPESDFGTPPPPGALTAPIGSTVVPSPCVPGVAVLCLNDGRFRVEVAWTDFEGGTGVGMAVPATDDTGLFWFFRESNLELAVKVLDGGPLNDHWWVFYGALTNTAFDLRVTDTETGRQLLYRNPSRNFASRGDTSAFPAVH